jgi:hypothetical protein
MVRIYDYLSPSYLALLLPIHYVILRHFLLNLQIRGLILSSRCSRWNLPLRLCHLNWARDLILGVGNRLATCGLLLLLLVALLLL